MKSSYHRDATLRGVTPATINSKSTELRACERLFRLIFENSGTANSIFDTGCRMVVQNSLSMHYLNMPPGEATGKTALEIYGAEHGPIVTERLESVMQSGIPETMETEFALPTGKKWFKSTYLPLMNEDHHIEGVQIISQDITKDKLAEDALRNIQKLESLGLLAGGIAHDFNNILGGIFGYIDLAAENTTEKKVADNLTKALGTIDRARALTSQLLTFARGGAPVKNVDILSSSIMESAKSALGGSNVTARFAIPESLWLCKFDRRQIGQVIENIVINAQQAMPDGGVIDISLENILLEENGHSRLGPGNYIRVTIADYGIGMPKDILPRIFDPFFTTKTKGHGLGLATSFSIVNRHGGCLEVESEQGKGSVFRFYLPACTDPVTADTGEEALHHRGTGTFLLMDDEEVMRDTIGDMLVSFGYEVIRTRNGEDALEAYAAWIGAGMRFAGIVLDLTIPDGIGGKEVVEVIRKTDSSVPVFVASGYADDPVMAYPDKYGFTGSICKPFRKRDLAKVLGVHLIK